MTVGSYGDSWKLRRQLEAATGCWRGQHYDGKCSFYFNSYFFRTTPTNRDLREKAVYFPPWMSLCLFEKSTRMSIISNSVTHLRSYTNTAIADIARNSARAPMSPHRVLISSHWMASVRVFHDVSQCFKSVSWCFTSGSWCFNSGSWCFTMFYKCFMMFYYV